MTVLTAVCRNSLHSCTRTHVRVTKHKSVKLKFPPHIYRFLLQVISRISWNPKSSRFQILRHWQRVWASAPSAPLFPSESQWVPFVGELQLPVKKYPNPPNLVNVPSNLRSAIFCTLGLALESISGHRWFSMRNSDSSPKNTLILQIWWTYDQISDPRYSAVWV